MATSTPSDGHAEKRMLSHSRLTRAAKRIRLTEYASRVAPTETSQPQSALLRLPQEIRDQVYTVVFQGTEMELRWEKFLLDCKPTVTRWEKYLPMHRPDRGLPSWMMTCRQILYEVLDFIGRAHTFKLIRRARRMECEVFESPNLLVFSRINIRSVAISQLVFGRDFVVFKEPRKMTPILHMFKQMDLNNINLELYWLYSIYSFWMGEDQREPLTEVWSPHWNGKFRKVRIKIRHDYTYDRVNYEPQPVMAEAEKLATLLVGSKESITWKHTSQQVEGYDDLIWTRWLVVERKV